jgi:DNA-directed RNA polymerase
VKEFKGIEYIKIAAANEYGMDKMLWEERIAWFDNNINNLDQFSEESDSFLFTKAVNAYFDAMSGKPTGYIMALDATASGLQIMACLSGCKKTAAAVNLIDNGAREDVYTKVADGMNAILPVDEHIVRAGIKKEVMTHYYNKRTQPSLSDAQFDAFHEVLDSSFSGGEDVMSFINDCWDSNALEHKWTLPDGHVANVKVVETTDTRIEVDELDHTTFTYRYAVNQASKVSTSLCPNFIHSLDAWVAREMVRRAKKQGFQLAHIHDSFWSSPNHMNKVRDNYRKILAWLADSDVLQNFIQEVTGKNTTITKDSSDLSVDILKSEYALS